MQLVLVVVYLVGACSYLSSRVVWVILWAQ